MMRERGRVAAGQRTGESERAGVCRNLLEPVCGRGSGVGVEESKWPVRATKKEAVSKRRPDCSKPSALALRPPLRPTARLCRLPLFAPRVCSSTFWDQNIADPRPVISVAVEMNSR